PPPPRQKLLLIERVIVLKKIELFKHIPGEIVTYIAEVMEEINVKLGDEIIREGDKGSAPFYIVLSGVVDIYEGGHKVGEREENGVFGEKILLENEKFEFAATARSECTLLLIRKEELLNLMSKHTEILECWIGAMNGETQEEEVIMDVLFGDN
ncbi:MAG: cyclic nucleotide-binding domain-containing protein, partial [Ekhidna sp.]|nr:cyclic nucleotide-binding domain-containing protein [Ekhidna sp.]